MSGHDHFHANQIKGRKLLITIFLNLLITLAQFTGALFAHSLALLSDAFHNLSDSSALLVSWLANRLTKKKSTKMETFGFRRAEIIAAFINSSFLLVVAVFLITESVERISQGNYTHVNPVIIMVLSGIGILINGFSALLLKKESSGNMNIRSSYLHLFVDMLSSIAVFLGGLSIYSFGFFLLDPLLSILIAGYLIILSWRLVIASLRVLMQFTPAGLDIEEVAGRLIMFKSVKNIHHVHAWQLNDHEIFFEAHVEFDRNMTLNESCGVLEQMRSELKERYSISHTTFQAEFEGPCNRDLVSQERNK